METGMKLAPGDDRTAEWKKIRDKCVRIFGGFYATGGKIESNQNH
jgi:hypothetical protein